MLIDKNALPDWYGLVNRFGSIPCFYEHGGESVFESMIIAEYLQDRHDFEGTSLMPTGTDY